MKVFVVYWHPEPQSFNSAMFHTACEALTNAGNEVRSSDLYEMRFDPVSSRKNFKSVKDPDYLKLQLEETYATEVNGFSAVLDSEMGKLEWCDLMIWQFPMWCFGMPAVLKGWVDRVFARGRMYDKARRYETGVFHGKRALLSLTTGGKEEIYRKGGANGDIHAILRPIHRGNLQFFGFDVLAPQVVYAPVHVTHEQRVKELADYAARLKRIGEESPIDVGIY